MKKLLFLLLIALASCEKQGDCYECTSTLYFSGAVVSESTYPICNATPSQMDAYLNDLNYKTHNLERVTTCELK